MAASTITRRCAAIRHAHKLVNFEPPTYSEAVKATLRGIRRAIGAAPKRKTPAVAEIMHDMARTAPSSPKGLRDRALLLLGFGGAFRRSELVALNVADIEETDDGLRVTIRRSKTDQEAQGATIAIIRGGACCPLRAVKAWLDAAGISEGPLFRPVAKGGRIGASRLTATSVCDLVKAYADHVGLDAKSFRGTLAPRRLSDQRGPPRRFCVQDAGRVAAQEHGRLAGVRTRRRPVSRSCRGRTTVGRSPNRYNAKVYFCATVIW